MKIYQNSLLVGLKYHNYELISSRTVQTGEKVVQKLLIEDRNRMHGKRNTKTKQIN